MKRCIFYLPYRLEEKANGARMIRPRKMALLFKPRRAKAAPTDRSRARKQRSNFFIAGTFL